MTPPLSSQRALQRALYQTLASDTELVAILGGQNIYDAVPHHTKPPFVVLDDIASTPLGPIEEDLMEHTLTLRIVTREAGYKTAQDIIKRCTHALTQTTIVVNDYTLINRTLESADITRADNNRSHIATLAVRFVTERT